MIKRFGLSMLALAGAGLVYGAPEIADAAQRRDAAQVKKLVEQKADVNAKQPDGTTALMWAVHWNDVDLTKALLKAGADPKIANRLGASPLSEAAALGNVALASALLDAGADPKSLTTSDGETVLMTAARAGNFETVKLLIDRGADVNARENYRGQTALMWAAAEKHADVVKLLLDRGADWKVNSLLHETKMPKLSAASSVSPMARGGMTAMAFAARVGDIPSLKVMMDAGVDINIVDGEKTSPLVTALVNKQYTAAKFLLDRGADPNVADTFGRAALYAVIDIRNEDYTAVPRRPAIDPMPSTDIIKEILTHKPNVNQALVVRLPNRSGMDSGDTSLGDGATPLMRAARAGDGEVIKLLLTAGADLNLKTKEGNTAMLFAAGVGYRDKNTTGTEAEALDALKITIANGQDINQINSRGETALHGAAGRGADSIVAYLVENGAKMDVESRSGQTPLDVAMGKGSFGLPVPHDSTVALLKKLGASEGKPRPAPAKPAGPKPGAPKPPASPAQQ